VGALEAKKLLLLLGWTMERCEFSFAKDNRSDTQMEIVVPWPALSGVRNKAEQAAMCCEEAWQADKVMGTLKGKLFSFLPVGAQGSLGRGTSAPGAKNPDDGRQNPVSREKVSSI
jgi:hypothetical protein